MRNRQGTKADPEVRRSASQIMFGHLPLQTVDINQGVWRVERWRRPQVVRAIDLEALKAEVLAAAQPWTAQSRDGRLGEQLRSGRRPLVVHSLDRENGVEVAPFPRLWLCSNSQCRRVHQSPMAECSCGAKGRKAQLHFVSYCNDCGTLAEPTIFRCPTHQETAIRFPGTMAAGDIVQSCPQCSWEKRGFIGRKCSSCGRLMMAQVHRSASVYTPRTIVLANAADRQQIERVESAGGSARALDWVVRGMQSRSMDIGVRTADTLRATLAAAGLSESVIAATIEQAQARGEITDARSLSIPEAVRAEAEKEARNIAIAFLGWRNTIQDLRDRGPVGLRTIYEQDYADWLGRSGIVNVDHTDRFPILIGGFGYTRGNPNDPRESALVPFISENDEFVVYGEIIETEALLLRLDPRRVVDWLIARGVAITQQADELDARVAVLQAIAADGSGRVRDLVTTLVHSYCHRFIRVAAVHTGVERTSLSELLVPHHLGFFVYAAARGDFVLGGLQAVFEGELHRLLQEFRDGEHRCALDPGCSQAGGACMACLHLGEPSCRLFNRSLDRGTLTGTQGYLPLP
jgi:hypothetical protein